MNVQLSYRRPGPWGEVVLAVLAAIAGFAVASLVCVAARHLHVPAVVLGLILLAAVLVLARMTGILYALPVGVAAVQAYDWFFLPPLRDLNAAALSVLGLLIAMTVIVGRVTTTAARNAVASERARGLLADDQAALRRVATLVAGGARPAEVFQAVADELAGLIGADSSCVARLDDGDPGSDPWVTIVGSYGRLREVMPVGMRVRLKPGMMMRAAVDTRESASLSNAGMHRGPFGGLADDLEIRTGVSTPVLVGSRPWGVVVVATRGDFQPGYQARIAGFTELAAMAIANTEADEQLSELADVQASLRRLALLIAQGKPPELIFSAINKEVLRHFGDGGGTARLVRFELDGTVTFVAQEGSAGPYRQGDPHEAVPREGILETVRRTGRPARVNDYRTLAGGEYYERGGVVSAVAVPVLVNARLWGMIVVGADHGRLPADLEVRLSEFTELVATAVADAQSRAELTSSRARIVAAADETRRRIERDLHDGVQQSLVTMALRLRSSAAAGRGEVLEDAAESLLTVIDELRELSHGIHPAILSDSGLQAALRALARRAPVPMEIEVDLHGRLPAPVEVGAYYVVSEMLTNAVKHANAAAVRVELEASGNLLTLRVHDDGVGGADPDRGTGLLGLKDRIEALGGTFDVHSPAGSGTTVTCRIPLEPPAHL
ncbi:GAF domain-containing protein [Actinoplanes sp. TBRC 11911]|uniref:GAF domain-containing sensor histidine kinase n=1 Tax=Actinoplanes sp. TBRC 11911 TaxID=2729386 RepID=UPI00145C4F7D|nr:GAF domain-containing protein [Actinoplanes sp. TBRC 11911]NMO51482.1 GAF domain-containing protein [Actinoplanes sp. TBRC 11911]